MKNETQSLRPWPVHLLSQKKVSNHMLQQQNRRADIHCSGVTAANTTQSLILQLQPAIFNTNLYCEHCCSTQRYTDLHLYIHSNIYASILLLVCELITTEKICWFVQSPFNVASSPGCPTEAIGLEVILALPCIQQHISAIHRAIFPSKQL